MELSERLLFTNTGLTGKVVLEKLSFFARKKTAFESRIFRKVTLARIFS
jgi:hypothetical protein